MFLLLNPNGLSKFNFFFLNISEIVAKTHIEIFFNFGASSRKITTTPCFFFLNHITPQSRYARGVILKFNACLFLLGNFLLQIEIIKKVFHLYHTSNAHCFIIILNYSLGRCCFVFFKTSVFFKKCYFVTFYLEFALSKKSVWPSGLRRQTQV